MNVSHPEDSRADVLMENTVSEQAITGSVNRQLQGPVKKRGQAVGQVV